MSAPGKPFIHEIFLVTVRVPQPREESLTQKQSLIMVGPGARVKEQQEQLQMKRKCRSNSSKRVLGNVMFPPRPLRGNVVDHRRKTGLGFKCQPVLAG